MFRRLPSLLLAVRRFAKRDLYAEAFGGGAAVLPLPAPRPPRAKWHSISEFADPAAQRRDGLRDLELPLHYTKRARQTDPSRSELCSRSLRFLCAVPRALATCHVKPTLTLVRGLETKQEFSRKRTSRPRHASNLVGALNKDGR